METFRSCYRMLARDNLAGFGVPSDRISVVYFGRRMTLFLALFKNVFGSLTIIHLSLSTPFGIMNSNIREGSKQVTESIVSKGRPISISVPGQRTDFSSLIRVRFEFM